MSDKSAPDQKCKWTIEDGFIVLHHVGCIEEIRYVGGPVRKHNGSFDFKYCPYCGREIEM